MLCQKTFCQNPMHGQTVRIPCTVSQTHQNPITIPCLVSHIHVWIPCIVRPLSESHVWSIRPIRIPSLVNQTYQNPIVGQSDPSGSPVWLVTTLSESPVVSGTCQTIQNPLYGHWYPSEPRGLPVGLHWCFTLRGSLIGSVESDLIKIMNLDFFKL